MASLATRVSVGTSAVNLVTADNADLSVGSALTLRNTGSTSIYLGGASVTTGTGFEIKTNESFSINTNGNALYAISASGTNLVHVLQVGV